MSRESTRPPIEGYIYIRNWAKYQHPDAKRRAAPGMAWIKDYVDQLDNDAYFELPLAYRAGLQDIRRLVAAVGQGRCSARADYLQKRCSWPAGWSQKILERLIQEGFIEVRASRAQAARKPRSRSIEGSKEPQIKKKTRARSATPKTVLNGDQPHLPEEPPLTRAERQAQAKAVLAKLAAQQVKEL